MIFKRKKTSIMKLRVGQHVETNAIYLRTCDLSGQKTREQMFRSGKVMAIEHHPSCGGWMVWFRNDQDGSMEEFPETRLQPATGVIYRGNEKLTDTTIDRILS